MQFNFLRQNQSYSFDSNQALDISIPLVAGLENVNCFYAPPVEFSPVESPEFGFIGAVARGGAVNFFNVRLNPHGNGTHTECVGHITPEQDSLQKSLQSFHFFAKLVSLYPQRQERGDRVIERSQIEEVIRSGEAEALVLRTLPNDDLKLKAQYSGANPPYLHHEAVAYLADCGVEHLLLDLPSVDREEDEGQLLAHKAFWRYPELPGAAKKTRQQATITELIYVPPSVPDGYYLLNLQITSLDLDASPSKPVLYALQIEKI
jgi:kynurenine formamidase